MIRATKRRAKTDCGESHGATNQRRNPAAVDSNHGDDGCRKHGRRSMPRLGLKKEISSIAETRKAHDRRAAWILADWRRLPDGVNYCRQRGGGRWLDWEKRLLHALRHYSESSLLLAGVFYSQEILSGDWPALEWVLPSRPGMLETYLAMNPGRRVHPALEEAILNDGYSYPAVRARAVYLYAHSAIQGRWEAGEGVILEATKLAGDNSDDSSTAVADAAEAYRQLAFGRNAWPELVAMIRSGQCHPHFVMSYCLRSRLDLKAEVAEGLLNTSVSDEDEAAEQEKRSHVASAAEQYAELVVKGRWEAGEQLLSGFPFEMYSYARFALKCLLPEHLHNEMVLRSFETTDDRDIKEYLKWCDGLAAAARGGSP